MNDKSIKCRSGRMASSRRTECVKMEGQESYWRAKMWSTWRSTILLSRLQSEARHRWDEHAEAANEYAGLPVVAHFYHKTTTSHSILEFLAYVEEREAEKSM